MIINNIECRIQVGGQFAEEYRERPSRQSPSTRKSCYIVSRSRTAFGFHLNFTHPSYRGKHVHSKYFADGTCQARTSFEVYRNLNTHTQETSLEYLPDGRWEARPFYFQEVEVCEEEEKENNNKTEDSSLKEMGTLKVKVWETEAARIHDPEDEPAEQPEPEQAQQQANSPGRESESSSSSTTTTTASASSSTSSSFPKKLSNGREISHRTTLGRPRILGDKTSRTRRKHPCLATFVFKYLCEDKLKEQGIIPPPPPAPVLVEQQEEQKQENSEEMDVDTKPEEEQEQEKKENENKEEAKDTEETEEEEVDEPGQPDEYYLPSPTVEEVMRDRLKEVIPPGSEDGDGKEDSDESKIDGVKPLPVAEIFVDIDDLMDFP